MHSILTPEMLLMNYKMLVLGVSIILAGGGIGFAIGAGLVCGKALECMGRVPETRPILTINTFVFTGFVSNFPFIVLAFGAWFLFANPFIDTLKAAIQNLAG